MSRRGDEESEDVLSVFATKMGGSGPKWEHLNPCPTCEAWPEDAPEEWDFLYCWRCGYRPAKQV